MCVQKTSYRLLILPVLKGNNDVIHYSDPGRRWGYQEQLACTVSDVLIVREGPRWRHFTKKKNQSYAL